MSKYRATNQNLLIRIIAPLTNINKVSHTKVNPFLVITVFTTRTFYPLHTHPRFSIKFPQ